MAKIKVKQTKSTIKQTKANKSVIASLGLGKINKVVEHEDNPVIRGMIRKVNHLVEVE